MPAWPPGRVFGSWVRQRDRPWEHQQRGWGAGTPLDAGACVRGPAGRSLLLTQLQHRGRDSALRSRQGAPPRPAPPRPTSSCRAQLLRHVTKVPGPGPFLAPRSARRVPRARRGVRRRRRPLAARQGWPGPGVEASADAAQGPPPSRRGARGGGLSSARCGGAARAGPARVGPASRSPSPASRALPQAAGCRRQRVLPGWSGARSARGSCLT